MTETVTADEAFYAHLADNHYSPLWQLMGGIGFILIRAVFASSNTISAG